MLIFILIKKIWKTNFQKNIYIYNIIIIFLKYTFFENTFYYLLILCMSIEIENIEIESILKWMKDLYPDDHKYYTFLKKVFRHEFRKNWFRRISTPMLEQKSLFEKSFSNDADLINSLYCFDDVSLWEICVSSNSTIWILRSYLSENLHEEIQPMYLYYMDKHINKNLAEKEVHQIWCEIIWEDDPILEAQLMFISMEVLKAIWLWDKVKLKINTLWNDKEMEKYLWELKSFYENKKHILSEETLEKFNKNPLSIFSSEIEDELILSKNAPSILKFLKKDSKTHYLKLKEYLDVLNLQYEEDNTFMLKENYYDSTLWQIEDIENWEVLIYWWRYNSLSTKIWTEKEIPATWFKASIIKIITLLRENKIKLINKDKTLLYFVQLWDEAKKVVLPLSLEARKSWINTMVSLWTPSMKEQIIKAQRIEARFVVMVWIMEARNGVFQVRNTVEWTQEDVKKDELIDYVINKVWKENLNFYSPIKDLIKE